MTGLRAQLTALLAAEVTASGRSRADLARAVGISPKHMSQVMHGHAHASPELATALLAELGRRPVLSTAPLSKEPTS